MMRFFVKLSLFFALVFLSSCVSITESLPKLGVPGPHPPYYRYNEPLFGPSKPTYDNISEKDIEGISEKYNAGDLTDKQKKLLLVADSLLGKNKVLVNGKKFQLDCSGLVMGIYHGAGIDLTQDFNLYNGGGVTRLHKTLENKNLLAKEYPQPGDLIFWDNTYDKNKNGRFDDYLTHVGMVIAVDETGQLTYIHHNYLKGIVLEYMNLKNPDQFEYNNGTITVRANSPMRMRNSGGPRDKWLSSHLFRDFGKAHKLN